MAHKPQMKTAASNPKLSDTTVTFLNAQNQDLHAKSIMQTSLLITLPKLVQIQSLPHPPKEDIHMEPPAPTHVFSEAATQTPAPLPVLTTPTSSPTPVTSAPAMSKSSKPGPPSRPSFAKAVAKNLCPNAPPFVQGPPHAPQPPTKATQGPVLSKCSKRPYFATHSPSRHQFYIEMSSAAGVSLPNLINQANSALSRTKSSLHINSAQFTNSGIMCATASVPIQSDLNIVEATLPPKIAGSWASLPYS
ncbi:hypothetical protein P691DRAFT_783194 [Macrolepiota fuliginosa MF-IS2]|uniref:Uncharacterized protein n=1 Tax=Macrolepiota fuliginosa MF-IS2 TaxID=1400762 RepID=A0A9P5WYM0_9AGAR|nr:hypothetical protein P691DRAFT_783194 [Macrolepiota fuliginosa MF-IS2]